MGVEQKPGNTLEKIVWRGTGVGVALEDVRLIATLLNRILKQGLWKWVEEDFSRLANFVSRKTK